MLYLGHFSFDELDAEGKGRHGYFCCVVDADAAENAVNEFRRHLCDLKKTNNSFRGIIKIYIEDIIGIQQIPRKAIVTRLQSSEGEFPKSVSHSLPSVNVPGIEAFGWAAEMKKGDVSHEEYQDSIPFMEFA
jgi:hypothetical protein